LTVGGGVANPNFLVCLSTAPEAERVPCAISIEYSVAAGNLTSGSNISVRVPSHRHLPGGVGVSFTGTSLATVSACDVTATIGWLNVIDR
jgi:hypothetical protein